MTGRRRNQSAERGQSSVELAVLMPLILLLLLTVVQVGLLARDQLLAVHASRIAGRAVVVDPSHAAAAAALHRAGLDRVDIRLSGDLRRGGFATVEATLLPTRVALVGRLIGGVEIAERLTVLVEE